MTAIRSKTVGRKTKLEEITEKRIREIDFELDDLRRQKLVIETQIDSLEKEKKSRNEDLSAIRGARIKPVK
jgi:flagellar biosynthesis chaperone FliJ